MRSGNHYSLVVCINFKSLARKEVIAPIPLMFTANSLCISTETFPLCFRLDFRMNFFASFYIWMLSLWWPFYLSVSEDNEKLPCIDKGIFFFLRLSRSSYPLGQMRTFSAHVCQLKACTDKTGRVVICFSSTKINSCTYISVKMVRADCD